MPKSRIDSFWIEEVNSVKFILIPISANLSSYRYGIEFILKSLKVIKDLDKKCNFDIVHGHSGFVVYGLATAIAGKVIGKSTIHTIYCPVNPSLKGKIFTKLSLRFIDKIVVISKNTFQSLTSLGIQKEKIDIIPPLIDFDKYYLKTENQDIKEKLLKNGFNTKTSLFVGNLKPNKGLDLLIDILVKVKEKIPNIKFIITTEPKKFQLKNFRVKKFLEIIENKIRNYQLKDSIVFLESVEDMPKLITLVDLIIIPFRNTYGPSDYPLIAIEAMACKKPIVAFNVGGLSEIIKDGNNGRLIPLGNIEKFAEAINDILLNKKESKNFGENGYKFIRKFLSPANTYLKMEKIYEKYK